MECFQLKRTNADSGVDIEKNNYINKNISKKIYLMEDLMTIIIVKFLIKEK